MLWVWELTTGDRNHRVCDVMAHDSGDSNKTVECAGQRRREKSQYRGTARSREGV